MSRRSQPPVEKPRATNSPSIVRTSFLTYLKTKFPYKADWVHPVSGLVFSHADILARLKDYMEMEPSGYKALWYLWTSQGTRAFIADQLHYSGPTVKRRWDKSINTVLLMLLFPELRPDSFKLYDSGL